jgi:hypothetical protein
VSWGLCLNDCRLLPCTVDRMMNGVLVLVAVIVNDFISIEYVQEAAKRL